MQGRKALGKGLASLIPDEPKTATPDKQSVSDVMTISVDNIAPNRLQPRRHFSNESITELADSIKENGIIQPLVVTAGVGGRYELIAGERRLRAAKVAGLERVPVVIKAADPELMLELALIENIQREDLNPIDEALAYNELIDEFGYTQEEVAKKVSKSRPYITNLLRLLSLPKVIQEDVVLGRMTSGHARALLGLNDLQQQLKVREEILHSNLSVREVEQMIRDLTKGKNSKNTNKKEMVLTPQTRSIIEDMIKELGTKVKINPYRNNKGGRLIIEYYTIQDLNNIYKKIVSK